MNVFGFFYLKIKASKSFCWYSVYNRANGVSFSSTPPNISYFCSMLLHTKCQFLHSVALLTMAARGIFTKGIFNICHPQKWVPYSLRICWRWKTIHFVIKFSGLQPKPPGHWVQRVTEQVSTHHGTGAAVHDSKPSKNHSKCSCVRQSDPFNGF